MAIVSYTLEEIKKMPSLTDWERLRNMKDEDIDYSDIPPLTDEDFARATRHGKPLSETTYKGKSKESSLTIDLSPNILSSYRKTGRNWKARLKTDIEQFLNQRIAAL